MLQRARRSKNDLLSITAHRVTQSWWDEKLKLLYMGQSAWNGTCPLHDQPKNEYVNFEKKNCLTISASEYILWKISSPPPFYCSFISFFCFKAANLQISWKSGFQTNILLCMLFTAHLPWHQSYARVRLPTQGLTKSEIAGPVPLSI